MNLLKFSPSTKVPGFAAEFIPGQNCTSLEIEAETGYIVVRNPLTERMNEGCSFDLVLMPGGWGKLAKEAGGETSTNPLACSVCGATFQNSQGLGSHMKRKHG